MSITDAKIKQMIEDHMLWCSSGRKSGAKFSYHSDMSGVDLSGAQLSGADLSGAVLNNTNMRNANLSGANLKGADMVNADLTSSNLHNADLRGTILYSAIVSTADLSGANMRGSDARFANITRSDLYSTNISGANMYSAKLSNSNMSHARCFGTNLRNAYMDGTNLKCSHLDGATLISASGIISTESYINNNFKKTRDGYIVYKVFGLQYSPNPEWIIKPGSIIEEPLCIMDRRIACGSGVNAATLQWLSAYGDHDKHIWKCLIRHEWLDGVCAPYATDGKIRCKKLELIEII